MSWEKWPPSGLTAQVNHKFCFAVVIFFLYKKYFNYYYLHYEKYWQHSKIIEKKVQRHTWERTHVHIYTNLFFLCFYVLLLLHHIFFMHVIFFDVVVCTYYVISFYYRVDCTYDLLSFYFLYVVCGQHLSWWTQGAQNIRYVRTLYKLLV